MTFGVGIKEMICARVVLIDAPFHEPHAEDTRVKIQILLRGSGDRCDVMKPADGVHRAHHR